jgi:glutathione S-transferase
MHAQTFNTYSILAEEGILPGANDPKATEMLDYLSYLDSLRKVQAFRPNTNIYISLPYKVHKIDISKDTQKEPWFRAINPNGRIPALTDTFTDGKTINLFESGSIMQYLVDRYDTEHKISFPKGSREYYEVNNWLFFMNAGVGPMQGQASKFPS